MYAVALLIPVVWLALLTAPCLGGSIVDVMKRLTEAIESPLHIVWCKDSIKCILVFLGMYAFGILLYYGSRGNTRDGEEHGSAKWGTPQELNKQLKQKENFPLSKEIRLGMDTHKHRRNLNVFVLGGSGAGKTRFVALPNILQANCSYVITDPKGEILANTGYYLLEQGYDVNALRTLTTESTAVLMPFSAQEISYEDGFYCGQNAISRNQIFVNREKLLNGNGFYLGTSGSGKSFFAKKEIAWIILMGLADVIVMDPESEYGHLIKALGGEVIRIAADSRTHINAMDMDANYSDSDSPLKLKADFMFSLCEQLMGPGHIGTKEKTIIDRCTTITYREYLKNNFTGTPPTLKDFHKVLLAQPEPEAKELALAVELFADGSLNTFAYQTNVATDNPYICYDIHDLGKHLRSVGMLVVLDSIYNRILRNRKQGRMTFVFIDEIYLLFSSEYSSNFLLEQWKRARKCGACNTGISQNVEELLKSDNARMMLANSEFITLLNQAPTDRQELSELLGISDTQLSYVSNAEAGKGLLLCAGSIVPFEDKFPKDTELYKLMTTKPREMLSA